jgi:hypothetical protein
MLISNPLKKLQKSHAKKVFKYQLKVTDKWSFLLLLRY